MSSTFYLTTGIPYINGRPHIGHVYEWMQADAIARYQRLLGKEVAFASGADENSLKNVQAAEKAGVATQAWLDEYADLFRQAYHDFGISLTAFRRGSDQQLHWPGVQHLWQRCADQGDLYQQAYEGLYCVGCESFYTEDELKDGKCPEHLVEPEVVKETNYFFRLSRYQDRIRDLIERDELAIISDQYKQEMLGFINQGLEDFSVSRSSQRSRGVGVPVPGDNSQVMYVWFDALAIYLTAIGFGHNQSQWEHFWPADVHVIGKGINRFHSVYWIGMLLSAGIPLPKMISVHGYITSGGQKMGKSLGNVIDPFALVERYGLEPVRHYLLKEIPTHADGDFTYERFEEMYNADLANGLGNLCARVAQLAARNKIAAPEPKKTSADDHHLLPEFCQLMDRLEIDSATQFVWRLISQADGFLSERKPWLQTGDDQKATLVEAINRIIGIGHHLQPFLPKTAEKILSHFQAEHIQPFPGLFPRL